MVPKLEEFSVEELQKQLYSKKIDKEFLVEYIVKRDKVYNKLIDKLNDLERENQELRAKIEELIKCAYTTEMRIEENKAFYKVASGEE